MEIPDAPLRDYHGLRIYLNEGDLWFPEAYFTRCTGRSGARVADFSGNGRPGIAAIAFFPEWERTHRKASSFEQTGRLRLTARTYPAAQGGRKLCRPFPYQLLATSRQHARRAVAMVAVAAAVAATAPVQRPTGIERLLPVPQSRRGSDFMLIERTSRHSVIAVPAGGEKISALVRDHVVPTDQPFRAGGSDTAPTPLELLTVSLASCVALYVQRYCEAAALEAAGLAVEVKPYWRENPGRIARFDVLVHLPPGVSTEHRGRIEEVARKCPVHHTLAHAPEVTLQLQESALAEAGAS